MTRRTDIIDLLKRYLRDDLTAEQKAEVETSLANDAELQAILRVVQQLAAFADDDSQAMPTAARKLADQLFKDFHRPSEFDRVPAGVTVFDSAMLPIPEGIRPAQIDTRQLRFRIGTLDLVIMLYPIAPDSFELMGQLSNRETDSPMQIRLQHDKRELTTEVDPHGLFRFDRVPVGTYQLFLESDGTLQGIVNISL